MVNHDAPNALLRPLRAAIATGDHNGIVEALPEPSDLLPALFQLAPADRDAIIAELFSALPTDEDRWEIIEASAMDSLAYPERGAFAAIAPLIPASLLGDARALVASVEDAAARVALERAMRGG